MGDRSCVISRRKVVLRERFYSRLAHNPSLRSGVLDHPLVGARREAFQLRERARLPRRVTLAQVSGGSVFQSRIHEEAHRLVEKALMQRQLIAEMRTQLRIAG